MFRFRLIAAALILSVAGAAAETLPLPQNLVALQSDAGEKLLLESKVQAFFPLSNNFVTQKTQAFCGVASIVMVLNALGVPAPASPEYEPYRTFTQDNVLDQQTEGVLPRALLDRQGMTLDQLGRILALKSVAVDIHHASDDGLDAFREAVRLSLETSDHFVLVNYLRAAVGQGRGGHISPLAAYDERADKILIMDVARYKYPPVWVPTADLYAAMNTRDRDNDDRTRGYILVSRSAAP